MICRRAHPVCSTVSVARRAWCVALAARSIGAAEPSVADPRFQAARLSGPLSWPCAVSQREEMSRGVANGWDQTFERALRSYLPHLPGQSPLEPDLALPALGLDSIGMIALLATLEDAYGVVFPEEALVVTTFRTPRTIWSVVGGLLAGRVEAVPADLGNEPGR
jgi:acyl carrier protein